MTSAEECIYRILTAYNFQKIFSRVRNIAKKRLFALSSFFIRPSDRMERLGSHWTDFHEI
jgi:hypothetical protein